MLFLCPYEMLGCGIGMLLAVTKRGMPQTRKFITCGNDDDDEFLA